nr:MAG TPA: hypothetical protein [Caudoviricetes sp.]
MCTLLMNVVYTFYIYNGKIYQNTYLLLHISMI